MINKSIIQLGTSTGSLLISEDSLYLFYDRHSGFCAEDDVYFFNNLHHDIQKKTKLQLYRIFYNAPLRVEQLSLSAFFRKFLSEIIGSNLDYTNSNFLDDHKYHPFIWHIGEIHL